MVAAHVRLLSQCTAEEDAAASQPAISEATTAYVSTARRSCGCKEVLLRTIRECAREANWAEERQQEVRWGALLCRRSFRQNMMPVIGCALERVMLQHRLRRCTAVRSHRRQHHPKQIAQSEFIAALHRHKDSCCPATQLLAQHSLSAC